MAGFLERLFGRQEQLSPEIAEAMKGMEGTNLVENYGTYVPRDSRVVADYDRSKFFVGDSDGYVRPYVDRNTAHINRAIMPGGEDFIQKEKFGGTYGLGPMFDLNRTIGHELAHTTQPRFFGKRNAAMDGMEFTHYGSTSNPRSEEILASLRGAESAQRAGTTVFGGGTKTGIPPEIGKEAIKNLIRQNPGMTEAGAKRYFDLRMFPEYQVMHERDTKSGSPIRYRSLMDLFK